MPWYILLVLISLLASFFLLTLYIVLGECEEMDRGD